MPEYKIKLTWEAIYDVTDIADYIEAEFGQDRADRFQTDIGNVMGSICSLANDQNISLHQSCHGREAAMQSKLLLEAAVPAGEIAGPSFPGLPFKNGRVIR